MDIIKAVEHYKKAKQTYHQALHALEQEIKETLGVGKAAELLSISRNGLYKKFEKPDSWTFEEIDTIVQAVNQYKQIFKKH